MKAKTQCERVLAKARSFDGVSQSDFCAPVCDGGPPITRVAARLYDLDLAGHSFECIGWRSSTKVFRLIDELDSEARRASVESDTHKMCGSSEISPGVPLAPGGGSTGASGERRDETDRQNPGLLPAAVTVPQSGRTSGVPVESSDVEVAGRISNDPGSPHAGLVVPPAAGDLSTGRLFEVESTPRKHWDEAA